jgi:hypothetical protein
MDSKEVLEVERLACSPTAAVVTLPLTLLLLLILSWTPPAPVAFKKKVTTEKRDIMAKKYSAREIPLFRGFAMLCLQYWCYSNTDTKSQRAVGKELQEERLAMVLSWLLDLGWGSQMTL